ncbi:MAG: YgiQ family radical SAM protein, partial [Desulfobacterales bacterium]
MPTTLTEVQQRGWSGLDVILVTGDSYIDSPHIGVAVIGHVLLDAGYRVGIIAQPDPDSPDDIRRLGAPELFWGVTGGCVDSMVANYTALNKKRRRDDFTPGGLNTRRPDRAVIVYTNLIRRYGRPGVPIVLGGIEASLRRITHYDFWSNRIRRSILFDAKADILVYGMGEKPVRALARALRRGKDYRQIRGICYKARQPPQDAVHLPSHARSASDPETFRAMFELFYRHNDPLTARRLCQRQDNRYLVQNPPPPPHAMDELDAVYAQAYEYDQHPYYERQGPVRALDTIRFSLATHRGCYGECHFCAIAVHQGRTVQWRSQASLLREARRLTNHPRFKGVLLDVGGPTANMYGFECDRKYRKGACRHRRCVYPKICEHLPVDHSRQVVLLEALRRLPGVRKVFVASGLRYDLVMADRQSGRAY